MLALSCLWAAGQAGAQAIPVDRLAADRFQQAPGAGNYIALDGASVSGHLVPAAGMLLDYAHKPLVLVTTNCGAEDVDCGAEREVAAVRYEVTANIAGSLTLFDRFQVGMVMPISRSQGDTLRATTPTFDDPFVEVKGSNAVGVGDPTLSFKARLLGDNDVGFGLASVVYATAPLGQATAEGDFLGDDGATAGGHMVAEYRLARYQFAANLGGAYRPKAELLAIEQGSEMRYGAGAAMQATRVVRVKSEIMGSTRFRRASGNPLELRAAGELLVGDDLVFTVGAGVGLSSGAGAPIFRGLAGGRYRPTHNDADGDGVLDASDTCPNEAEDRDGYEDDDGCPEPDNDGDGLLDHEDRCPSRAEDQDQNEDGDGCPDEDNDGDGILDGYDSCPDTPEDMDGDRDDDGCPDNDRDGDGLSDTEDQSPDEAEDTDGFGDEDGCPEVDFDGDGIPDEDDQCPDEPEDFNQIVDDDGCPESGPAA